MWSAGQRAVLSVQADEGGKLEYSVATPQADGVWLSGKGAQFHCNGSWLSLADGSLSVASVQANSTSFRVQLGAASEPGAAFGLEFAYEPQFDSFSFSQTIFWPCADVNVSSPALMEARKTPGLGEFAATREVATGFPVFDASAGSALHDSLRWATWQGRFMNGGVAADWRPSVGTGLPHWDFVGGTQGGPLLLFDPEQQDGRTGALVLSPGNHFMEVVLAASEATAELAAGVQGYQREVATAGPVTFKKMLVPASADLDCTGTVSCVNGAMARWGSVLRTQYDTDRLPEAKDVVRTHLGFWTDNGAVKYVGATPDQQYLSWVMGNFSEQGVPVKYVQLDPYWYRSHGDPGCSWSPVTSLFPDGISGLYDALNGTGLLLYSNFWVNCTAAYPPYWVYTFTESRHFDVAWAPLDHRVWQVSAHSAQDFYVNTMMQYQREIVGFEMDYIDGTVLLFPEFTEDAARAETWIRGAADASWNQQVPMQECMSLASVSMASVDNMPAVTNVRASEDDFPFFEDFRWEIAHPSVLLAALDLAPFMDVVWTRDEQPHNPYVIPRFNSKLFVAISALSKGPLGIGDYAGHTDKALVMRAVRSDGRILHPSYPATPVDAMYLPHESQDRPAKGTVWQTHSQVSDGQGGFWTSYSVLAVDVSEAFGLPMSGLWPQASRQESASWLVLEHSQRAACLPGESVSRCGRGVVSASDGSLNVTTDGRSLELHMGWRLFSLVPILPNGWAAIGQANAFAPLSPQRVSSIDRFGCSSSGVALDLVGAVGEEVRIQAVDVQGDGIVQEQKVVIGANGTATLSFGSAAC